MHSTIRFFLVSFFLLYDSSGVTFATAEVTTRQQPTRQETWYRVEISDAPAGWMSETETHGGETSTFESHLEMTIRRGVSTQTLTFDSSFVETVGGSPVEAWARQQLGEQTPIETHFRFLSDGSIELEIRAGDSPPQRSFLDQPADSWLTPSRAQREIEQRLITAGSAFSLRTIDPLLGARPIETHWQPTDLETTVDVLGTIYRCKRWKQTQGGVAPGVVSEIDVDANGEIIRSRTDFLGLALTMTLWPAGPSGRTDAAASPPELLRQTFVHPSRGIERPRQTVRARYAIDLSDAAAMAIPSGGPQQVERTAGGVHITVDLDFQYPPAPQPRLEQFLRPSVYLDFESEAIRALVETALNDDQGDPAGPAETASPDSTAHRALGLRDFVSEYLREKDLRVLLATASEVAESRSGDCTEHSVLLAALLRSSGIPSRVVTGIVYVDSFVGQSDVFGYHMWTQAWIGDRWLDLDATLDTVFDATHIALGFATLNDDTSALLDLAGLADLSSNTRFEILETTYRQ